MSQQRTLLWTPVAKERPRTHLVKGSLITYTPKRTAAAERALREQWTGAPALGPIDVDITFSDTEVELAMFEAQLPESRKLKGDIDNYLKLIMDALNGVAWADDRQIVSVSARKM